MNYQVLAECRYEIRRFLISSEQAARAAGIAPQQHEALLAIKGLPVGLPATVGVLAERLQIRHHSAVELMDRMETKGLLCRRRSETDRREVLLRLTVRGEMLLRQISRPHQAELRSAGPALLRALKAVIHLDEAS